MHIDVIVPVYNEEEALPLFWQEMQKVTARLPRIQFGYVFVNDGSRDGTLTVLREWAEKYQYVRVVSLARNFGKEAALTAGLDEARQADAAIVMDADLQDPPELIEQFVAKFEEGFDMVYGKRIDRSSDSWCKRVTANSFYMIYNRLAARPLPPGAGDFRLISRRAIEALLRLPERERFMKGLFNWIGFNVTSVPFVRPVRSAGSTKWNGWRLWNFALSGLTASTTWPLRLWTYVGVALAVFAFGYAVWVAASKLLYGNAVSGYASLMVVLLFFSGIQLISLGIIGEYLGRIFIESKQRPLYLVDERMNCSKPM